LSLHGADEGILLSDERFQEEDRALVAYALAMAIRKAGNVDLILCGRQEGDWDAGQVGLASQRFSIFQASIPSEK